ncbi:hypothetical protein Tsubulata_004100 [Turnera subulata]|uniref:Transcription initiation factor TFIID subunit 12 domain-containing protein n=1 Tax=Turnera subulata TaxID=218843 RepID=A0A9Q0FNZ3_9ROSI|nr:hypothetical protein Tsubulata_004100 [Turnera subulata]
MEHQSHGLHRTEHHKTKPTRSGPYLCFPPLHHSFAEHKSPMDQQTPTVPPSPSTASVTVTAAAPQPTEPPQPLLPQPQPTPQPPTPTPALTPPPPQPQPQPQPQQQQQQEAPPIQPQPPQPPSSSSSSPSPTSTSTTTTPLPTTTNSNSNPNPNPPPKSQTSTASNKPLIVHRPWQQPQSHFPQFAPLPSSSAPPGPTLTSSPSASASASPISAAPQRGGVAIGVPAPHAAPPPSSFSSSFGQQFGGLSRGPANVPESVANNAAPSQVRHGMQGVGMMGPMSSSSQMRPVGIPSHHQQRPVQASMRPPPASPNSPSPNPQNFQGHSFMRSSSVGPPALSAANTSQRGPPSSTAVHVSQRVVPPSSSPSTPQTVHSSTQPWLSSGPPGKPPLPSPSFRPQVNSPSLQQRSHIPHQHHSLAPASQQQHTLSGQQQHTPSGQQQHAPSGQQQHAPSGQQQQHSPSGQQQQHTPSGQQQQHTPSAQQQQHIPSVQQHPRMPSPLLHPHMSSAQPQQHTASAQQQQHTTSVHPQQSSQSNQRKDNYGQQFPPSRVPQPLPHAPQVARVQGAQNQNTTSPVVVQPNTAQSTPQRRINDAESDEPGNRILGKRSIHELVSQIDPSEKLDPEVEDILADIADEFVESITTFGCSLAKHRKSDTLEAKDILLHLERNWNITLPGFSGDEIKSYRKPLVNDIHKERLAVVKKSIMASEMANAKNSVGQAAGHAKNTMGKTQANAMVSPNLKVT